MPRVPHAYPAMALGTAEATPLQIASAYTGFAANGTRTTPIAIDRVTTGNGTTIAQPAGQKNEVLRPDVAYVITSFMKDVVNRGTGAPIRARGFKFNVAGKTGTSRDGWFAGYTPNLVCVVWVGFDDGSQLGLTGAASALPIWADFMSAALTNHPEWTGDWSMPEGIQQAEIDPATGQLAKAEDLNKRPELFINGTLPTSGSEALPDEMAAQPPAQIDGQENEKAPEMEPATLPETLVRLQEATGRRAIYADFGQTVSIEGLERDEATELFAALRSHVARPEAPRAKPTPKGELRPKNNSREPYDGDSSPKLQGTITLDIDPTTGLIAVDSCPVIRTKTFIIGQEPKKYCGPEYHKKAQPSPSPVMRMRVVNR